MIGTLFAGAAGGALCGFVIGLSQALISRDGIWPGVWAGLILFGAASGAGIGAITWWLQ